MREKEKEQDYVSAKLALPANYCLVVPRLNLDHFFFKKTVLYISFEKFKSHFFLFECIFCVQLCFVFHFMHENFAPLLGNLSYVS